MATNRQRTHEILELARPGDQRSRGFEMFSVLVFSLEYLLRIWSCVESCNTHY